MPYKYIAIYIIYKHIFLFIPKGGPSDLNVTTRGLISETPRIRDIIKQHNIYCKNVTTQNFEGDVLAYITPVSVHQLLLVGTVFYFM